jgi:hypothetical protein
MPGMSRMRGRAILLLLAFVATGCWSDRSPRDVAHRFLDKYYLEIDQQAALQLCVGSASGRIKAEIADLDAARREGLDASPSHPRMYYRQLADQPVTAPGEREQQYDLTIDSQGVMLHKRIDLVLKEDGGRWRIANFAEADMAHVQGEAQ